MTKNPFILLGGISEEVAVNFKLALAKLPEVRFHIVYTGDEIIDYLSGEGKFSDRLAYPFPSWMLLNFQLPGRSALEVMRWIREGQSCNVIPIILFSDAPTPEETQQAYELKVNSVFKKPQTLPEMEELFATLCNYWCRSEIPSPPHSAPCR